MPQLDLNPVFWLVLILFTTYFIGYIICEINTKISLWGIRALILKKIHVFSNMGLILNFNRALHYL